MADHHDHHHAPDHAGPNFQLYMMVFYALCVCTGLSFLANFAFGQGMTSAAIILVIAVVKASLVVSIFMHLKYDWGKLFCIVIPVAVMAVMMMIVLLPDQVFGWKD